MAVPVTITDLSVTVASNSPAGADTVTTAAGPDEYFRSISAIVRREQAQATAVASGATVDLGAIATGSYVHITGTTTITSFGTVAAGISRTVVFDGILTLTHNATSLILPGGANITTAAGDVAVFRSEGSGNWRCEFYEKASGLPLDAKLSAIAGLAVTDGNFIVGNGTSWVAESGATVRTSLGLGTVATLNTGTGSGNVPLVGTSSATDALAGLVELATSAEVAAGTDTARAITPAGLAASKIVAGTAVASTSGTAIDFTSIPLWVKRITVMLDGVSTSGTSVPIIQLGDSGGIETSGYAGSSAIVTTSPSAATMSTGFSLGPSHAASYVLHGAATITLIDQSTNKWSMSGVFGHSAGTLLTLCGGSKSLTAALDRVRITTTGGTDTFDAGTINILYE